MPYKKPTEAAQLRAAKLHIAVLEKENADLHEQWTAEITARAKDRRELETVQIRCIKLKGVVEYLEEKLKDE